jgi:hypothetical protein
MDLSFLKYTGLIMFAALAFGFLRRKAGHRKAREDYPALAARLHLEYRPPSSPTQIGTLYGNLRGFVVLVDPDDQRKLIVRFRGEPEIDFRTYSGPRRPSRLEYYSSQNRSFDLFFKTRYVSPELAERLDDVDLPALIAPFQKHYARELKQLNITQHGVTCTLDFGTPPHIPAAAVEELLPALLDWAQAIEPLHTEASLVDQSL